MARFDGKVVLVTGASRGFGAAAAQRLAVEGAQVVLVARTIGGLEAVDDAVRVGGGRGATLVPLDLADQEQLEVLGHAIWQRFGRLDMLVGNAAILGALSPVAHCEADLWPRVFAVNVLANQRLIRVCDPMLRAAPTGRVVFLTDQVATGRAYWGAYAASKAALECLMRCYAQETARLALRVNAYDPGVMRTALRAEAFPGETVTDHPSPDGAIEGLLGLLDADCQKHGEVVRRS